MKGNVQKRLKDTLSKKHLCYVLITCDPPTENGEMKVEMTYEGDAALAAYLIEGAQQTINDNLEIEVEQLCCENKILFLE